MIQIAICDDQFDHRIKLTSMIQIYIDQQQIDAEISTFSHADKLLAACETQCFQLYLLDIVMPMVNGIELGIEIRRLDQDAQLIYVTSSPEFALDSFATHPQAYLVKPLDFSQLSSVLDLAFARIGENFESSITVKTREGLRVLRLSTIACCERTGKFVRYLLTTGEQVESLTIRQPFVEAIAPLLTDRRFIQPHASFAVNMSRVERLTDKGFLLRGGKFIPVVHKQMSSIRNAYLDYRLAIGDHGF